MSKLFRIWVRESRRAALGAASRLLWRAGRLWAVTKDEVKQAVRRRVKPRFWLFMIGVTLLVFAASFAVLQIRYAQGEQRLARVLGDRDRLAAEASALSDQLAFARTDDYIIRTARDELGMIMPGEVRYVNGAH